MRGATLFSGIGAPECAMPEIQWLWCAEIEPFPSAVLKERFGHPNLGDVTANDFIDRARAVGVPDIIVFGSPCQGFSVAGKRLGLDDPRSNLALHALRICRELAPTWIVFENVPGMFSSWSGEPEGPTAVDFDGRHSIDREFIEISDFAEFLQRVQDIGYFGAWTILDAQFAGVAQRRERLFFVGHLGDWRAPAAVLLIPESLCGYPPSRGEKGKDVTGSLSARTSAGGGLGTDIAHALRADGFDASEDGTGRGTPLIPVCIPLLEAGSRTGISTTDIRAGSGIGEPGDPMFTLQSGKQHAVVTGPLTSTDGGIDCDKAAASQLIAFTCKDHGADASDISPTLRSMGHDGSHANAGGQVAVCFDTTQITSKANRSNPKPGDPSHPLASGVHAPAIAFNLRGRDGGSQPEMTDVASVRAKGGAGSAMQVRRLTPL